MIAPRLEEDGCLLWYGNENELRSVFSAVYGAVTSLELIRLPIPEESTTESKKGTMVACYAVRPIGGDRWPQPTATRWRT